MLDSLHTCFLLTFIYLLLVLLYSNGAVRCPAGASRYDPSTTSRRACACARARGSRCRPGAHGSYVCHTVLLSFARLLHFLHLTFISHYILLLSSFFIAAALLQILNKQMEGQLKLGEELEAVKRAQLAYEQKTQPADQDTRLMANQQHNNSHSAQVQGCMNQTVAASQPMIQQTVVNKFITQHVFIGKNTVKVVEYEESSSGEEEESDSEEEEESDSEEEEESDSEDSAASAKENAEQLPNVA